MKYSIYPNSTNHKKAFSLIELSIVVLIIGILIAGVTQGSRVLDKARLSNARTLTQSSPVNSIKGLTLWLETTTEKSFDESKAEDSIGQENWYDINPQSISKFTLTQSTSGSRPTYTDAAINNLPALYFDGSNDYYEIPYTPDLNPNKFTIFSVVKVLAVSGYHSIYTSRGASGLGYMLYVNSSNNWEAWYGLGGSLFEESEDDGSLVLNENTLITTQYNGSTVTLGRNGEQKDTDDISIAFNIDKPLRIGSGATESTTPDFYFNGYIAEIIIFNRALKNEEQESIENYLIKKWGISS